VTPASTRRAPNDTCSCCSQRSCFRCFFNKDSLNVVDVVNMDEHRVASNDEVFQDVRANPGGAPGVAEDRGEPLTDIHEREMPESQGLLGPRDSSDIGRKCLVLDLDETLVHSSFQPVTCSFSVPIVLEGIQHEVYVMKRPFVDEFLAECAKTFELVIFTASLSEYANPVIDKLDTVGLIKHRLFRDSCVLHEGQAYVKDLSRLGRKLKDCIIIDNSPLSYLLDPQNAIGCTTWFGNPTDTELRDLLPVLNGVISTTADVRQVLGAHKQSFSLISQHGQTQNSDSIVRKEEVKLINKTGATMLNW
jgi:RNA polymerase II subunit A small phosphatase-like protein